MTALMVSPAWADETARNYTIGEQDLASSLNAFALQSEREIVFSPEDVDGLENAALSGRFIDLAALDKLLDGTGLTYAVTPSNAIIVTRPQAGGGALPPARTVLAQAGDRAVTATNQPAPMEPSATDFAPITGRISAQGSDSGLPGALVRLQSTGEETRTDDVGQFRFPSTAVGTQVVEISYLGYVPVLAEVNVLPGRGASMTITLQGADELDRVIVYGTRSSRALSLNQERTADNTSTVVSADLLGNFTGTTLSDALRRVPGVAFQQDEKTGDGTNIIIRGLEPDMNQITLNGLRLPEGSGLGRSPSLNNILADSIETVTISKTLLASQDSSGTGGLVEIVTKSPLDRGKRYMSASVEGGKRADDYAEDYLLSGTVAGSFGKADNFGLSASLQYRNQNLKNYGYNNGLIFGEYLPLQVDGSPTIYAVERLDPSLVFPFEDGEGAGVVYPNSTYLNSSDIETTTIGGTLSGEWQIGRHTNLRLDYNYASIERDSFNANGSLAFSQNFVPMPIQELGGEVRVALTNMGAINVAQAYQHTASESETHTLSFRGDTEIDNWRLSYLAGYAKGETAVPGSYALNARFGALRGEPLAPGMLLPEATDPVEGRVIWPYEPRTGNIAPLPLLSDSGWALLNDTSRYYVQNGTITETYGQNERKSAQFSAQRDFRDSFLKYIEVGASIEDSHFDSDTFASHANVRRLPCAPGDIPCIINPTFPPISEFGLSFDGENLQDRGIVDGGYLFISRDSIDAFWDRLPQYTGGADAPITFSEQDNTLTNMGYTKELNFAAYVQTRFDIGKLQTVAGVRYDLVESDAAIPVRPNINDENGLPVVDLIDELSALTVGKASVGVFLPRVQMNYRYSDNLIFRAGYFQTVARPSIRNLSSDANLNVQLRPFGGPNQNQPFINVFSGNPDLDPAFTHNFDFRVERYFDQIGVFSAGVFYKRIEDSLQTTFSTEIDSIDDLVLPDHPFFETLPDNIFVSGSKPENSDEVDEIWGLELAAERQFTFLPGVFSGLGAYANFTYTDSSRQEQYVWYGSPVYDGDGNFIGTESVTLYLEDQPFDQSPKRSGTVALTYNKYGFDASLAYSAQARRRSSYQPHGRSQYNEGVESLDLRVEYVVDKPWARFSVFFEGADLLKGTEDPDLENSYGGELGVEKYYSGATFLGGRSFRVGLRSNF